MCNLDDSSDDDGGLLEEVGDAALHGHDSFTAHLDHQLGDAVRHAQLHLSIKRTPHTAAGFINLLVHRQRTTNDHFEHSLTAVFIKCR